MEDLPFLFATVLRLASGIPLTLQLAAGSVSLGALFGLGIALMRLSGAATVVSLAWAYVQLIRSVPLLVLIFLIYYGLGQFGAVRESTLWPVLREPYWCALLALTLNSAAYASEIIRGGLLSVSRAEIEAARACGMSRFLLLRRIVLPLAVRQALPAYGNEIIAMVKATSLASLVTLMEVTGIATAIASETYRPIEVFVAAGSIYLAINFILTRGVMLIEHRLTPHLRHLSGQNQLVLASGGVFK
ncbi:MAG: ABC transporter permease [Hyphomicrobiales bacterium]